MAVAAASRVPDVMNTAIACRSVGACAELTNLAEQLFSAHHPDLAEHRNKCQPANVSAALAHAPTGDAVARANAVLEGCSCTGADCRYGKHFSWTDALAYHNFGWRPGFTRGGIYCSSIGRFGAPFVHRLAFHHAIRGMDIIGAAQSNLRGSADADGGKTVCDPETLLRVSDCTILSIGINNDTNFEHHVHRAQPDCKIFGMDGTLDSKKLRRVPRFITLMQENFGPSSYLRFQHLRRIRLLKLDCEGCEYKALPPLLEHVCVDQIVMEVHRRGYGPAMWHVMPMHELMTQLHQKGYRVAFIEPNAIVPWLDAEYTLVRDPPCG